MDLEFSHQLARFYFASRDPAIYIALLIAIVAIQALLWGIARFAVDMEWWKAAVLGITVLALGGMILPIVDGSVKNLIGIYSLCALAVWILAGFLYEPELWQRLVLTFVTPLLGAGAWLAGVALRNMILG